MTNKQLETSREIRQWLKIIIPAGTEQLLHIALVKSFV